jgi:HAD superfamily hydrolase (TIGR01509 family)
VSAIVAVIFDLDGVLVDSEPAHRRAARRLVAPAELADEEYAGFVGSAVETFMTWIHQRYAPATPAAFISARYSALVEQEMLARPVPAFDGAVELLGALKERGIRIALASQSLPTWVHATLAGARLDEWFEVVATATDVARPKPAADIYQYTAARLGVAPHACLAIEDSIVGVQSALAAEMVVVQSRQGSTSPPPQSDVEHIVDSLRDFDLGWLEETSGRWQPALPAL